MADSTYTNAVRRVCDTIDRINISIILSGIIIQEIVNQILSGMHKADYELDIVIWNNYNSPIDENDDIEGNIENCAECDVKNNDVDDDVHITCSSCGTYL